jgi:hypothetical protein
MSDPDPFTMAETVPSAFVVFVELPAAPTEPMSLLLHVPDDATVTVFESLAVPPGPVQASVNVVVTKSALLVALPLVAFDPDHPPDAVHDVAFVLVQDSCVVLPLGTLAGFTVRLTVGDPDELKVTWSNDAVLSVPS